MKRSKLHCSRHKRTKYRGSPLFRYNLIIAHKIRSVISCVEHRYKRAGTCEVHVTECFRHSTSPRGGITDASCTICILSVTNPHRTFSCQPEADGDFSRRVPELTRTRMALKAGARSTSASRRAQFLKYIYF